MIHKESESESPVGFRKLLGSWSGALTVLAVVIGAGIYSVPQQVATYCDGPAMMMGLWAIIGLLCMAAALVWAEVGARLPYAGSDYLALRTCFGRHVGFLYGWRSFILTSPSNRAALGLIAAEYAVILFPELAGHQVLLGIGVIVILGAVNMAGLSYATGVNVGSAGIKVIALMVFVIVVFAYGDPAPVTSMLEQESNGPLIGRLALAAMLVYFSYTGWGRILAVAEEFNNPGKQIMHSMVISMSGAIVLYLLVNAAYLHVLGMDGIRTHAAVGSAALDLLFGKVGAALFAILVIVSVIGSMSTSIMSSSRLYYAMAKNGTFFQYFHQLDPRTRVPTRAIGIHVVLACTMLILRQRFVDLVTSAVFINLIFFALRAASIFILRKKGIGDDLPGFRIPLYPVLPLFVIIFMLSILVVRVVYDWDRAWFDLLLLAVGIPAAMIWFRIQERKAERE
ncbi:MAG: APC family permease [Saprospiraceae bacterium]|nr:APC family permease [Saprospiraceae bacterium]